MGAQDLTTLVSPVKRSVIQLRRVLAATGNTGESAL